MRLDARLIELQPLRHSPAGVPVASCSLQHESRQPEGGMMRDVSVTLQSVAIGELASILAAASPGMRIRVTGFLAAKSLRSSLPVLHLSTMEFLEGN